MNAELGAPLGDVLDPSTTEFCRHIDEVGESLRADLRGAAVLIARYWESVERRQDQLARRTDALERCISTLDVRVSGLEDDRKPHQPRWRR